MRDLDLPALLVTDLINVRYLSGFSGSNGALLLLSDERCWLATDSRYLLQAGEECPDLTVTITRDLGPVLVRQALSETGGTGETIGFEDEVMSVRKHAELIDETRAVLSPVGGLVRQQRMVKDESEFDVLRQACSPPTKHWREVLPRIRPGSTERRHRPLVGRRLA